MITCAIAVYEDDTSKLPSDEIVLRCENPPLPGDVVSYLPPHGVARIVKEIPPVSRLNDTIFRFEAISLRTSREAAGSDVTRGLVRMSREQETEDLCLRIEAMTSRRRSAREAESIWARADALILRGVDERDALAVAAAEFTAEHAD